MIGGLSSSDDADDDDTVETETVEREKEVTTEKEYTVAQIVYQDGSTERLEYSYRESADGFMNFVRHDDYEAYWWDMYDCVSWEKSETNTIKVVSADAVKAINPQKTVTYEFADTVTVEEEVEVDVE